MIATAIRAGLRATEIAEIDLAYAPAYGSAKDPVTMLGFIADNIATGMIRIRQYSEVDGLREVGVMILDVRTPGESTAGSAPEAVNIPVDK